MARIKRCGLRFAYAVRQEQTAVVLRAIHGVTFCVPTPESDAIAKTAAHPLPSPVSNGYLNLTPRFHTPNIHFLKEL